MRNAYVIFILCERKNEASLSSSRVSQPYIFLVYLVQFLRIDTWRRGGEIIKSQETKSIRCTCKKKNTKSFPFPVYKHILWQPTRLQATSVFYVLEIWYAFGIFRQFAGPSLLEIKSKWTSFFHKTTNSQVRRIEDHKESQIA